MINNCVQTPASGNNTPVITIKIINYLYMAVDAALQDNVTLHTTTDMMAKLLPHQLVRMDHTRSFLFTQPVKTLTPNSRNSTTSSGVSVRT